MYNLWLTIFIHWKKTLKMTRKGKSNNKEKSKTNNNKKIVLKEIKK